jgi:hypothetical protein
MEPSPEELSRLNRTLSDVKRGFRSEEPHKDGPLLPISPLKTVQNCSFLWPDFAFTPMMQYACDQGRADLAAVLAATCFCGLRAGSLGILPFEHSTPTTKMASRS